MPILAARSTVARGIGFGAQGTGVTPYDGPYGAYDALASTTVGSSAVAYVEFSGIPQDYKHLQLRCAMVCSAVNNMYLNLGAGVVDTTGSYSWHQLYSDGSSILANGSGDASFGYIGYNNTATYPNPSIVDIYDYSDPLKATTWKSLSGVDSNGTGFVQMWGGNWQRFDPVGVVRVTPGTGNFNQYSVFTLYGIR